MDCSALNIYKTAKLIFRQSDVKIDSYEIDLHQTLIKRWLKAGFVQMAIFPNINAVYRAHLG